MPVDPSGMGPSKKPHPQQEELDHTPKQDQSGKTFSQHMSEGAEASDATQQSPEMAEQQWFPSMHFTKKEWHQFMSNMVRFLSTQLKQQQQQMKKASENLKKSETGQS